MDRILNLKNKWGNKVFVAFHDSQVSIALPIFKNLFEAGIRKPLDKGSYLQEYFDYLQTFSGIVNDLNLNTRIWTKE